METGVIFLKKGMKTEGTEEWENVFLVSLCATLTEKKKMNETLGEIDPKTAKSRKSESFRNKEKLYPVGLCVLTICQNVVL